MNSAFFTALFYFTANQSHAGINDRRTFNYNLGRSVGTSLCYTEKVRQTDLEGHEKESK